MDEKHHVQLAVFTLNCKANSSSWCFPLLVGMIYFIRVLILLLKIAFSGKHTDGLMSVQWTSLNMRSIKLFSVPSDQKTKAKKYSHLCYQANSQMLEMYHYPLNLNFRKKCISLIACSLKWWFNFAALFTFAFVNQNIWYSQYITIFKF